MKKIDAANLSLELGRTPDYFICSASYEDRCLTTANALQRPFTGMRGVIFYSGDSEAITKNREQLGRLLGEGVTTERLSLDTPTVTTDCIVRSLGALLREKKGLLLLDGTTFTHEQFLIVVRYLAFLLETKQTEVTLITSYNCALQYSVNTAEEDGLWLSRGVREIRPVIGFSGRFKTGQTTQLILLVGFEHERARAVIEHIEPGMLALGYGPKHASISAELAKTNMVFEERLEAFLENVSFTFGDVAKFELSVVDPILACKEILKIATPDTHNVIVCPMNTKISTLGAALAALSEPRIQLMYVEPLEYNESGYSKADTSLRLGELSLTSRKY